jgi:hypothetical protein
MIGAIVDRKVGLGRGCILNTFQLCTRIKGEKKYRNMEHTRRGEATRKRRNPEGVLPEA